MSTLGAEQPEEWDDGYEPPVRACGRLACEGSVMPAADAPLAGPDTMQYRLTRESAEHGGALRLVETYIDSTGTMTGWCWAGPPGGDVRADILADLAAMVTGSTMGIVRARDLPGYPVETARCVPIAP